MLKKYLLPGLRMLAVMTVLTGFIYPLLVSLPAWLIFPHQANGSLVQSGGQVLGSELIGQANQAPGYFWPRPSATGYNPLPSGGSNLGPTSQALNSQVAERTATLQALVGQQALPADLLLASGSGLDPHISPQAALLQAQRVARERGLDPVRVEALVNGFIEPPQWGVLGAERVNVFLLNLALDALQ